MYTSPYTHIGCGRSPHKSQNSSRACLGCAPLMFILRRAYLWYRKKIAKKSIKLLEKCRKNTNFIYNEKGGKGMVYVLVIAVIGAVGFVVFSLMSGSRSKMDGFEGAGDQGPAPIHQELATLKDSAQKAELNYSLLQKELEVEKKTKASLEEELTTLKATYDKLKSECDLFKVENASLKGKLVERDRDNRKMIDELKILREKAQPAQKPVNPGAPAAATSAPVEPASAPKSVQKPAVDNAPIEKPAQTPIKPISIPNAEPEDLVILTDDFPPKQEETKPIQKPSAVEPENKPTNFKLVGEDEDDNKTEEDKDLQNPQ